MAINDPGPPIHMDLAKALEPYKDLPAYSLADLWGWLQKAVVDEEDKGNPDPTG